VITKSFLYRGKNIFGLEIREKDEKMGELDGRATAINETVRDLTRKHQLFLSESAPRTTYDLPRSKRGS